MLNQAILVGKVINYDRNDKIVVDVVRNYVNADGVYESDCFDIELLEYLIEPMQNTLQNNMTIAVKGRLKVQPDKSLKFEAEKVSYIG